MPVCYDKLSLLVAHLVISLPPGNSVAFGLKRTLAGFYEYTAETNNLSAASSGGLANKPDALGSFCKTVKPEDLGSF
jgi:hypothetical protein